MQTETDSIPPDLTEENPFNEPVSFTGEIVPSIPQTTPLAAPLPMARALNLPALTGRAAAEAHLARWQANFARDPDGFHPPGHCRHCNAKLGDVLESAVYYEEGKAMTISIVCCGPCADKYEGERALADRKAREARLAGIIPPEFVWWDKKRGNENALARALGAMDLDARKGVVLHGTTGTCKTRIAWQLVRQLVDHPAGPAWLFCDASDLAEKGIPAEAFTVHWLFIDDIGNEPRNGKWEANFLRLVRRRCDWHRPTCLTTQLTPTAFRDRFFATTPAQAIMRRFHERAVSVNTSA